MSRESHIRDARVCLAQARHFREREDRQGWAHSFSQCLLRWAANARRRAVNETRAPLQGDLLG